MPMPPTSTTVYEHITFDESQTPVIVGSTMKVVELVLDKIAYGWSPEELRFQHPDLSMGQIYSALAYYSDHQEELDREIDLRLNSVEQIRLSLINRQRDIASRIQAKKPA